MAALPVGAKRAEFIKLILWQRIAEPKCHEVRRARLVPVWQMSLVHGNRPVGVQTLKTGWWIEIPRYTHSRSMVGRKTGFYPVRTG